MCRSWGEGVWWQPANTTEPTARDNGHPQPNDIPMDMVITEEAPRVRRSA